MKSNEDLRQKKYLFSRAIKKLTKVDKKDIKNNYHKINKVVGAPNNFPNFIKEAIKKKKISQLTFFMRYAEKYPNDASVINSYASYFSKGKRPSPRRFYQILEYINTLFFNQEFSDQFQQTAYDIQHQSQYRKYDYFSTIFSSSSEVIKYTDDIINNAFTSFILYLENLLIILHEHFLSWQQLKNWIKVDQFLSQEGVNKIKLIKQFSYADMKILDYKVFKAFSFHKASYSEIYSILQNLLFPINKSLQNYSEINFMLQDFMLPIAKSQQNQDMFFQKEHKIQKDCLKKIGIDSSNYYSIYERIYPNFKINSTLIKTWPHLKDFLLNLSARDYHNLNFINSNEPTINLRILDVKFQNEYFNRLHKEKDYPQFNEQSFIFNTVINELDSTVKKYLVEKQPKYYPQFNKN